MLDDLFMFFVILLLFYLITITIGLILMGWGEIWPQRPGSWMRTCGSGPGPLARPPGALACRQEVRAKK